MILRVIVLLVVGWLIGKALKRWIGDDRQVRPPPAQPRFEPLARCSQCGAHVARKDLAVDGRCPACRRQA